MIFKCYLCNTYKFWNKKTCYEMIVTSKDGTQDLFSRKICSPCGEQIDQQYYTGKQIAEMQAVEIDEE